MIPHAASSVSQGAGINPQTTVHIHRPLWPFLYTPIGNGIFCFCMKVCIILYDFVRNRYIFLFMWGQRLAVFTWNNNSDAKHLIFKTKTVRWREKLFLHVTKALNGPGPPYYSGFTITLRHTTLDRTPLDAETST